MFTIGIDMSKDVFHAALDDQRVLVFANTEKGIDEFMTTIEEWDFPINDTTIGVESTGAYHLLFAATLTDHSWSVVVINPLESHRMITQGLRTVKTDRLDALKIRAMTALGKGHTFTDTSDILALKTLVVERSALVAMRKMTRQRLDVRHLKEKAIGSPLCDSFSAVLDVLAREIKVLEQNMDLYAEDAQILLRSIPGVGKVSAAALAAFVGDINRFASPEKLVAYIGLDSRVFQSGTSVHGKGFISKRGNKYLRHILFSAAFIAQRRNPELHAYFKKKLAEGKHYFSAMCAVERKLIHLIYAVWKRGTPYQAEPPR